MASRQSAVLDAYAVLGLEQGASLEVVKSTYKQLALKTHPDKNPGDEDATVQFQKLSAAYSVLVKHLDRSTAPPHSHGHTHSHFHPFGYEDGDYDDDDDYYDDEDDDYDSEFEEHMDYYMFLFEELLSGRASRFAHAQYHRSHPGHHHHPHHRFREEAPPESEEQYATRLRRAREEQELAAERRAEEEAMRKADQEREREQSRREAEQRKRKKASAKKVAAEVSRKTAEEKARSHQEQVQEKRSNVFAAARRNDTEAVKKGVWEDAVDAAGGEARKGSEDLVKNPPTDPKETLMHIAAKHGNLELVKWLDSHSAEADERNGDGMSAFHVALQGGHLATVRYFFEAYPLGEDDYGDIYDSPPQTSNLRLALGTKEPEAVWTVLDKHLYSKEEIDQAWEFVIAKKFQSSIASQDKYEEFINLFSSFGGFTLNKPAVKDLASSPPASPASPRQANGNSRRPRPTVTVEDVRSHTASPVSAASESIPTPSSPSPSFNNRARGGKHFRRGSFRPFPQQDGPPSSPSADQISSPKSPLQYDAAPPSPNFRGRGRGRGQFRGRGRGRGRGGPPVVPTQAA